jgi:tetratricopeptide (TPR) repeat protein
MPGKSSMSGHKDAQKVTKPLRLLAAITTRLRDRLWFPALVLVVVTVVAYLPALSGSFVWDDDAWTTGITALLRDVSGLCSMWFRPTALQQYYPLSGTTFWLDYHLWGFWTMPYHLENVLLHAACALLFWRLLRRLETPGAWLAGAIFALHPVMVESAAWITERKNVLSLLLYLGALLAYGRFNSFWKEDSGSGPRPWRAYALASLLFLGALLAKTTTFSFPAVILLIGWWKRGRIRWREDVLPTLPLFALSLGCCLVTGWLEKTHVGAREEYFPLTFLDRCLIAGRATWFYVGKLLWPVNLSFTYPMWPFDVHSWPQWLYPLTAVGTLVGLWLARRRIGRGPAAAAFFFIGALFPLLGFMNVYGMRFSYVWDHWVYLPSLGLIALAAALAARAADALRAPRVSSAVAAIVLVALGATTWSRARVYRGPESLWQDAVNKNPECWEARNNLGAALFRRGDIRDAIGHYQQALRINPHDPEAPYSLGVLMLQLNDAPKAIEYFQRAVRIEPDFTVAHNRLGLALFQQGRVPEAVTQFKQALQINPGFADAQNNLGFVLLRAGKLDEAIEHYEEAVRLKPDFAEAQNNLGFALMQAGKLERAIEHYEVAVRLNPRFAEAHNNLGLALFKQGRALEAIAHFREALRIKPGFAEAQSNLAQAETRR